MSCNDRWFRIRRSKEGQYLTAVGFATSELARSMAAPARKSLIAVVRVRMKDGSIPVLDDYIFRSKF